MTNQPPSGQYIFIDSSDRKYPSETSSDFTINLNTGFENVDDLSLQIQNITIPNSWYNINSNNSTFTLGATSSSVVIPDGNYTTSTFPAAFQTATANFGSGIGITSSYSSTTGKFTFNTADLGEWTITATAKQKFLGLSAGTHTSSSGVITSDQVADFSGLREIRISSDLSVQSANSWNKNANTLISVYPNVASGQFVNYQIQSFAPMKISNANLNSNVRFRLFDEYGDLVDLNGGEVSLSMVIYPE